METKVIKVKLDDSVLNRPEDLKKVIADAVADAIEGDISELMDESAAMAEIARKSWKKHRKGIRAAMAEAAEEEDLSGAEMAELLYAIGFTEGYRQKEKEGCECE